MPEDSTLEPGRLARLGILLAGIVIGQLVIYGPSLAGRKILLPLDILAHPNVYLPQTPEVAKIVPKDTYLADLVLQSEVRRRFAASELRAGRIPMWAPYQFTGAPFAAEKFSPFFLLECCTESAVVLAWAQMMGAMIAGIGAYAFFRRVLGVTFWAAAISAWCYPMTGFFVLWQGFSVAPPVFWLPWILLAVHGTVRRAHTYAPLGLCVATCLVLISGQPDVAAQVLLVSGLYGLWCLWGENRLHGICAELGKKASTLAACWALGFLLAAPAILPTLEYIRTGARMSHRGHGREERPPVGLVELPETVLPMIYGSTERGTVYIFPENQRNLFESAAASYTGALAVLFAAPLAWCSRRHRSSNVLWAFLAVFGLSWCLNLPGFVGLLRLPGLRMMSHDRLGFVTSFAFLVFATVGLDAIFLGVAKWRRWFWAPLAASAGLFVWCIFRTVRLPLSIGADLEKTVLRGGTFQWVHNLEGARMVQAWFVQHYAAGALWCGVAVCAWLMVRSGRCSHVWFQAALGALLTADLAWFACERTVQCDPALYYPRIPVLEEVAKSSPGRVFGYSCLPPSLPAMCGLRDVRGYDAVDPARIVDLLNLASDPRSTELSYASSQWQAPQLGLNARGDLLLSPVLDMLEVRYLIFRGTPPPDAHTAFRGLDYWVAPNPSVLPRPFIPRRVETVANDTDCLRKLASPAFDPREVAYVESPVNLPADCQGAAGLVCDLPNRVTINLSMKTAGLIVLADLWDKGWKARVDGRPVPILRTNHAVRGVIVPPGASTLEFRYWPASFAWGLGLAGFALIVLLVSVAKVLSSKLKVEKFTVSVLRCFEWKRNRPIP